MRQVFVGAMALIVALAFAGAAVASGDRSAADYARERAAIAALERQDALAVTLQPLDLVMAAAWRVVPLVILAGVAAYLVALAIAHVARVRGERRPSEQGLLPVRADQLYQVGPAALAAYHGARLAEAQRPQVPQVPAHLVITNPPPAPPLAGPVAPPEPPPAPPALPTFAKLLEGGKLGPGNPLLLGYDRTTGAAVEGSWLDLYSCAVGGLSGSGKSWTAAFLAAQAALHGARLVILDPHADNPESLASRLAPMRPRFVCEVADTPKTMLASVNLVTSELQRRTTGGRGEPWLFLADEFSALQRGELAEPLANLVEALGQEGRKLGLYGMVCGQVWTATRAGGSELRDSLASAYVHRLRPSQARMLTGLTSADLPADLLTLPAGSCYLLSTSGELRPLVIPQMRPEDIAQVAQLAAAVASKGPSGKRPIGFQLPNPGSSREATLEAYASGQQEAPKWSADEAEILAALRGGKSPAEVAAALAGATSGRRYQEAARKVADVIRRAIV